MTDTNKLLLDYAKTGSDTAFRELISRYLDLVYSVAFRRVEGNAHLAEDIAQSVFADLARKARQLPPDVMLGGWLHRHTCFVASTTLRAEHRRQNRERQAAEMNSLVGSSDNEAWMQLGPVLDEAIDLLEAPDREAIVLRYFERRDLRAVGAAFGIGEDAAQKRVSRAVDKLRDLVAQRGAAVTTTVLAASLAASAVSAAPAGLAGNICNTALAAGAGVGFVAGLIQLLAATKAKLALVALVVAVVAVPWAIKKSGALNHQARQPEPVADVLMATESPDAIESPLAASNNPNAVARTDTTKESGLLRLIIVSADGGQPIPTVPVDYRRWDSGKFTGRKLQSTRFGVCEVYFPRETTTELELTTRADGFADTRLRWRKDRGDEIPTEYTLRLDRATPIGGTVVDADGQPVAGAKVGFNHNDDPLSAKWPEDHEFGWIEVTTESDGHWRMNRMAEDVIRRIYGSARHSDYVDSAMLFLGRDQQAESKLREESFVFQLGRPVEISGVVVDADGLAVSEADVLVGSRAESGKRTAKTAADGTFTVKGCRPGRIMVTAEAEGYAATTIEVADARSEPVRLTLQRGRVLRLKVVNQAGEPIPNANVWLDIFRDGSVNQPHPVPVQASFNPRTDKQGLVVWSNAPDMELQFDIGVSGYMRMNEFRVRPDGEEHQITLLPAVAAYGDVTDAQTGEPIPRFRLVLGWPQQSMNGKTGVNWSPFERDWPNFAGGKYRHTFEGALVSGRENPGYALKFLAEGYAAFESRVIEPNEGEVRLDVKLTAAKAPTVSVLLPDGQPAVNADVGLISSGVRLELVPGGLNRGQIQTGGSLLITDKQGRFHLPADESIQSVMVVHPGGFARASRAELAEKEFIQLQPWGRLEGNVLKGGKPAADQEFLLKFEQPTFENVSFSFNSFRMSSDKEGRFVFAQVPPSRLNLVRLTSHKDPQHGTVWSHQPLQNVEIQPGETVQVTVGGSGHTVKVGIRWPAGFARSTGAHIVGSVHTPVPSWMIEMAQDPKRAVEMTKSPEVLAFSRSVRQFPMELSPDGTLSAESVSAGEFEVAVSARFGADASGTKASTLMGRLRVNVPSEPSTGLINAGEVQLEMQSSSPVQATSDKAEFE